MARRGGSMSAGSNDLMRGGGFPGVFRQHLARVDSAPADAYDSHEYRFLSDVYFAFEGAGSEGTTLNGS